MRILVKFWDHFKIVTCQKYLYNMVSEKDFCWRKYHFWHNNFFLNAVSNVIWKSKIFKITFAIVILNFEVTNFTYTKTS